MLFLTHLKQNDHKSTHHHQKRCLSKNLKKDDSNLSSDSLFEKLFHLMFQEPKVTTSPFRVAKNKNGDISTFIGKYQIQNSILGHGGTGIVQLGSYENQKVAIKSIPLSSHSKVKNMNQIHEVVAMKKILHPNIPKLLDAYSTDSFIYIIMDLVEGTDLFDYVKNKKFLTETEAKRMFFQIINVVLYLHTNGILHNDLKIENLIFGEDNNVYLLDFGHATFTSNEQFPNTKFNPATYEYTAPEIFLHGSNSAQSDIWSLGIILFIMIYGYFPFQGTEEKLRNSIIQNKIIHPTKKVSTDCFDLITRMLQLDPNDRISLQDIKNHPWFLEGTNYFHPVKI